MDNLHDVESTEHFQELLSRDLGRVSLINFWASWAEPCKQMKGVVEELAKRYPKLLVLNVEAEADRLADIAESFEVEAVPLFVLLQGHTLLERVPGADAKKLTEAVANHATSQGAKPQSQTSQAPPPASDVLISGHGTDPQEAPEQLESRMKELMNQSKVVLFMKGSPDAPRCGFSRKICGILRETNTEFTHFDILTDEAVRQGLKKLNDWPTFPQLIIKGELVGGLDIVEEMVASGELKELVA